jgi:hypothetical protein
MDSTKKKGYEYLITKYIQVRVYLVYEQKKLND